MKKSKICLKKKRFPFHTLAKNILKKNNVSTGHNDFFHKENTQKTTTHEINRARYTKVLQTRKSAY